MPILLEGRFFLSVIQQNVRLEWDLTSVDISERSEGQDQIACKALLLIRQSSDKFFDDLNSEMVLSKEMCIQILNNEIISKIEPPNTPNFYILQSFIKFFENNLTRLKNNPHFNEESLRRYFGRSWKDSVIKIITELAVIAKSLSFIQKHHSKMEKVGLGAEEVQAEKLKNQNQTKQIQNFIIFNDSLSITPVYTKIESLIPSIIDLFKGQQVPLKEYSQMTQEEYHEQILEMCLPGVKEKQEVKAEKAHLLNRIVLTKDNYKKLCLIYLRLRANIPVIIMGQTGVGKTAIISYLVEILDAKYCPLNVHEGVTEEQIVCFIKEANEYANQIAENKMVIVFLDEVNTNDNISGLLKEILVDRHIKGKPLNERIRMIAACNPYQFKDPNILTSGIKHKMFNLDQHKLVYKVKLMPESIICFTWDYGSLLAEEEKVYIRKMIETNVRDNIIKFNLQTQDIDFLEEQVFKSQQFLRERQAEWSVSLRDVQRFCILLNCFLKEVNSSEMQTNAYTQAQGAYLMAINFNYVFKLSDQDLKNSFKRLVIRSEQKPSAVF